MTILDTIRIDMNIAMKERNAFRLRVLRSVIAAIQTKEKAGKTPVELGDAEQMAVLRSEVKKRRETADIYLSAQEHQRAAEETAEADIIETYLPAIPSDEKVRKLVADVIAETGASSMRDMGAVMKAVKAAEPMADGKLVSELVKAALA